MKNEKKLYKTTPLTKRNITNIIEATGAIEAIGTVKVGSLINGVVKKLYVAENETVKKGQLIALLDNGKGDTDVKRALGLLKKTKAQLIYQEAFFKRQEKLYKSCFISQNDFDKSLSNYEAAKASVEIETGTYEKAVMDYENTKILSPIDGIVIKKNVSLGEGVSSFLNPTVIYTIAEDIQKMTVELEIDETSIGDLKLEQETEIRFDTYPNKVFTGKIKEISISPSISKGTVSYTASICIDNQSLLLKPGMTVHAKIIVAARKNVLAVPGYVTSLNPKLVKFAATEMEYGYKPITTEKLKTFKKTMKNKEHGVKTIWILKNKTFVQKPIEVGLTDKIFFEVVSGLKGTEKIVIDVEETDAMKAMFKRLFGGGMSK